MRLALLLAVLSLGLSLDGLASPASAAGTALRWTNCVADGGTSNVVFACNTNTGFGALVPSFVLDAPFTVASIEGVVDVVSASTVLPAWWELQAGCRSGSLSATLSPVGPVACQGWTIFLTTTGINSIVVGANGTNTVRITFSSSLPGSPGVGLSAGIEYLFTALRLNFNRTVGTPSCSGCDEGACLTLNGITLSSPGGSLQLTTPFSGADGNHVTWQGGGSGPGGSCSVVSPARRSAWGAIKSLYR